MTHQSRIIRLFLSLVITLALNSSSMAANKKYTRVEEFVADQKIIRILLDISPGFGDQSATINVINRLNQMNFHGTYEFIYPIEDTEKVISLFNLPKNLPAVYFYEDKQTHKILFIREDEYIPNFLKNNVEHTTLGITGAYETLQDKACNEHPDCREYARNFADFANTSVFVTLQPWFSHPEWDAIAIQHDPVDHPVTPTGKFLVFPVATLQDAKDYLENDSNGRELQSKKPAIKTFIAGMENENYNVLPVYGWSFQKMYNEKYEIVYPKDIFQVITGARYAQITGNGDFTKPLIIAVFYNYDEEMNELSQLVQSDQWGDYEKQGGEQMRAAINAVGLRQSQVFLTASLNDADASSKIAALKPGQILLLSMGPLPKVVFDGLYTHTGNNIWPQLREGESSLNTLLTTGKPHFRCSNESANGRNWEPGFDLIEDASVRVQLNEFYGKEGFCSKNAWVKTPLIYQTLGKLIIDAKNEGSTISKYFVALRGEALKLENDRIYRGLEEAMKVVNGEKR